MYEHKVEYAIGEDEITEFLSHATVDGWELVSATSMNTGVYLFFKRPFLREMDPARV